MASQRSASTSCHVDAELREQVVGLDQHGVPCPAKTQINLLYQSDLNYLVSNKLR